VSAARKLQLDSITHQYTWGAWQSTVYAAADYL